MVKVKSFVQRYWKGMLALTGVVVLGITPVRSACVYAEMNKKYGVCTTGKLTVSALSWKTVTDIETFHTVEHEGLTVPDGATVVDLSWDSYKGVLATYAVDEYSPVRTEEQMGLGALNKQPCDLQEGEREGHTKFYCVANGDLKVTANEGGKGYGTVGETYPLSFKCISAALYEELEVGKTYTVRMADYCTLVDIKVDGKWVNAWDFTSDFYKDR